MCVTDHHTRMRRLVVRAVLMKPHRELSGLGIINHLGPLDYIFAGEIVVGFFWG